MGMFDEVLCLYPLPGGAPQQKVWQTKDFEMPYLEKYTITEDGRLLKHVGQFDSPAEEISDFHGDLNFYGGNYSGSSWRGYLTDDDKRGEWWSFVARFTSGRLTRLTHTHTVDDYMPISRADFRREDTEAEVRLLEEWQALPYPKDAPRVWLASRLSRATPAPSSAESGGKE